LLGETDLVVTRCRRARYDPAADCAESPGSRVREPTAERAAVPPRPVPEAPRRPETRIEQMTIGTSSPADSSCSAISATTGAPMQKTPEQVGADRLHLPNRIE
jgi:hypothetical protein